jgi:hypothetical protein
LAGGVAYAPFFPGQERYSSATSGYNPAPCLPFLRPRGSGRRRQEGTSRSASVTPMACCSAPGRDRRGRDRRRLCGTICFVVWLPWLMFSTIGRLEARPAMPGHRHHRGPAPAAPPAAGSRRRWPDPRPGRLQPGLRPDHRRRGGRNDARQRERHDEAAACLAAARKVPRITQAAGGSPSRPATRAGHTRTISLPCHWLPARKRGSQPRGPVPPASTRRGQATFSSILQWHRLYHAQPGHRDPRAVRAQARQELQHRPAKVLARQLVRRKLDPRVRLVHAAGDELAIEAMTDVYALRVEYLTAIDVGGRSTAHGDPHVRDCPGILA